MKAHLSAALIGMSVVTGVAEQRGVVTSVRVPSEVFEPGAPVAFTATGTNPCGALNLDYGDGNVVTHPISQLPATVTYAFSKPGTYRVVARGMGNCDGETASTIRIVAPAPVPAPAPAAPPAAAPAPAAAPPPVAAVDRTGALDRNRDGVISRDEWRADERSFRVHDWNRDGMLSGDEVREAEKDDRDRREAEEIAGRGRRAAEAADKRFTDLDRNQDGRITRDEWNGSRGEMEALDRNADWVLTRNEMAVATTPAEPPAAASAAAPLGALVVQANRPWTDSGLDVRQGDRLGFEISGRVRLAPGEAEITDPRGSPAGRRVPNAPVRQALAGALIGRIGDSEAFDIGVRTTPVRAPRNGRLYLGVNDDHLADNEGAYRVRITKQSPQ